MNVPLAKIQAAVDDRLWYKDAVIYQPHVKSFFDSNNDGIGDFPRPALRANFGVSFS